MKCSFCGINIERGTGKIFARNSGKLLFFCSTKCEKNMLKLRRKPRNIEWTVEAKQEREKAK
jgi:large subunit ribosomal protein L24e